MGIFISDKDNFDVKINYVFDNEGDVHVISDEDEKNMDKTTEEKQKIIDSSLVSESDDIPYNDPIDITKYTSKDIRVLSAVFRKPNISDLADMYSQMGSIDVTSGGVAPGSLVYYNIRKVQVLLKQGTAQDEQGEGVKINKENMITMSLPLITALSREVSKHVKLDL